MATIKDVAERAGVSLSTVSIVANGQGTSRKISDATQRRVREAMRELGYKPNAAARRLRGKKARRQLALFWADDFREVMLARFLQGMHAGIRQCGNEVDISINMYHAGELERQQELFAAPSYDAVIIANADGDDMVHLSTHRPLIPLVLYNREAEGYPSVSVDDWEVGSEAAKLVACRHTKNHCTEGKRVVCLSAPAVFEGMRVREKAFVDVLAGMGIPVDVVPIDENSAKGGLEAFVPGDISSIDCIFAPSDAVAMGVLHRCWKEGVRIPNDVGVVCVGNGAPEYAEYCCPPLTCVSIPMERMAQTCVELLGGALGLDAKPRLDCRVRLPVQVDNRWSL